MSISYFLILMVLSVIQKKFDDQQRYGVLYRHLIDKLLLLIGALNMIRTYFARNI